MESDESLLSIEELYVRAATIRRIEVEKLKEEVNKNIKSLITYK